MARKTYKKKTKNGTEYYFFRLFYKDNRPKDIYTNSVTEMEEKIGKAKKEMDGDLSTDTQPSANLSNTGCIRSIWWIKNHPPKSPMIISTENILSIHQWPKFN